jgi:uncharacterized surface protein with fasciclin (FAS1) repeats
MPCLTIINITLNKMKKVLLSISLALSFCLSQAQTAFEIIQNSPNHNTLEAAVLAAGLDGALNTLDPITVFAPTDDAFNALPAGTVTALLNDIPALTDILLYHVFSGAAVLSTDLFDGQTVTMYNGSDITVTINNGVFINGTSQVIVADIAASNGIIHVVNEVLIEAPTLQYTIWDVIQNSPDHSTLEAVVGLAGLDGALDGPGALTVFAPTDAAFALVPQPIIDALLADPNGALTYVLTYHVVPSVALSTNLSDGQFITTLSGVDITVSIVNGDVFINQAQVIVADIVTDNGVVHVLDAVIAPGIIANNVWDIIQGSPVHTILETGVLAAGLDGTLQNDYFYTVFAPTDAAFGALPAGTIESLIANPTALTDVLLYHVVGSVVASTDLSDGQDVTMLQGDNTTITLGMGGAMINNANIVAADLRTWNGIVHVIDAVLLPPASVNDILNSAVQAYPNPCTDVLTIERKSASAEIYSIYNVSGQLVASGLLNNNLNTISTNSFTSGMYSVVTESGSHFNFIKN